MPEVILSRDGVTELSDRYEHPSGLPAKLREWRIQHEVEVRWSRTALFDAQQRYSDALKMREEFRGAKVVTIPKEEA